MAPEAIALGAKFVEVTTNRTADYIETKMTEARAKRDLNEVQTIYQDLVTGLLQDKMDLQRIAMQYQQQYESITISDKDIEYLQNTLTKVLDLMASTMDLDKINDDGSTQRESLELLIKLLDKDTLVTMQLIGFNYKQAIGEPLTKVCGQLISDKLAPKKRKK